MEVNKLILFPLFIMILITLLSYFAFATDIPGNEDTQVPTGHWEEGSGLHAGIYYWHGDDGSVWQSGPDGWSGFWTPIGIHREDPFILVDLSTKEVLHYEGITEFNDSNGTSDAKSFSKIFDTPAFWLFIISGMAAAVAFGIKIFGTGISEYSQRLALIAIIYGGVWIFLTAVSTDLLNDETLYPFGWLVYTGLTLMFIFGIVTDAQEA